jgi:hypothetical protein
LINIFDNFCQLDECKNIKNIFLIGGWYNINYITLRNNINIIHDYCGKENSKSSADDFNLFINSIKLNLIGFNLPVKSPDGTDKGDDEDDHPDDYIFDSTTIYDRSSTPHAFLICQYSGIEDDMHADQNDSLLQVVYQFNSTSKRFEAFITLNAPKSPFYCDLLNQISFNVKDATSIINFIEVMSNQLNIK